MQKYWEEHDETLDECDVMGTDSEYEEMLLNEEYDLENGYSEKFFNSKQNQEMVIDNSQIMTVTQKSLTN